jgi:hypothetical protein
MELFIKTITITFFLLFLLFPVLLHSFLTKRKTRYKFIIYALYILILSVLFVLFLAWWGYYSNVILLKHYGYNFDGMNESEYYKNVVKDNLQRAIALKHNIMGIGWPLKAIFIYPIYVIYTLIVYAPINFINKKRIYQM